MYRASLTRPLPLLSMLFVTSNGIPIKLILIALVAIFAMAAAICAAPFYVSNYDDASIARVAANGDVSPFASGLTAPEGVAFDPNGILYVADQDGFIKRITPDGTVTTFASYSANNPGFSSFGGMVYSNGNLYVTDQDSKVLKVTAGGVVSTFATGLDDPQGLTLDANNNLYAATNQTISKITPAGVVTTYTTGVDGAMGLAFDSVSNLYVSEAPGLVTPSEIVKIAPGGSVSSFATGQSDDSYFGLLFSTGDIYAVDSDTVHSTGTTIVRISLNGTVHPFAAGLNGPVYMAESVPEPTGLSLVVFATCAMALRILRPRDLLPLRVRQRATLS
jgi:hypothetical protein